MLTDKQHLTNDTFGNSRIDQKSENALKIFVKRNKLKIAALIVTTGFVGTVGVSDDIRKTVNKFFGRDISSLSIGDKK